MKYSVIETRMRDGAERHITIRTGLTQEMAGKVRACRAYANKVKGRTDRTVEVVEENASDRVYRLGRTLREGQTEIHERRQGIHSAEDANV
jgi:transposase